MQTTTTTTANNGQQRAKGPKGINMTTIEAQRHDNGIRLPSVPTVDQLTTAIERHEGITALRARFAFYVPSTGKDQQPIDQQLFQTRTDQIARQLSRLFGGSTVIPSCGYWLDNNGRLISERINVVISNTDPALLANNYDHVINLAQQYGQTWYQQTIMINVDGTTLLINM